jgi:polyisoprenoid-binding protein YceI
MRRISIHGYVTALILISFATPTFAQEDEFQLDAAKTTVNFTLDATLHAVHGSFKAKGGSIRFDPQSGKANGKIEVDATSAQSGNDGRDRKMHKEVLESEKYPEISFSPSQIVGQVGPGSVLRIQGTFRIHGSDHPLTLSVPLEINGDQLSAKFHFVVPYVEWGMKNPSTLVLRVSKEVSIDMVAAGHLTPSSSVK